MHNPTLFLALIVTGGYTGSSRVKTTSIIDIANDQITSGPDLNVARNQHACNTVEIGSKNYAIVVGGYSGTNLASTELLDLDQLDQGSWIIGKHFTESLIIFQTAADLYRTKFSYCNPFFHFGFNLFNLSLCHWWIYRKYHKQQSVQVHLYRHHS